MGEIGKLFEGSVGVVSISDRERFRLEDRGVFEVELTGVYRGGVPRHRPHPKKIMSIQRERLDQIDFSDVADRTDLMPPDQQPVHCPASALAAKIDIKG